MSREETKRTKLMGWANLPYCIVLKDNTFLQKLIFDSMFDGGMPIIGKTREKREALRIYDYRAARGIAELLEGSVIDG